MSSRAVPPFSPENPGQGANVRCAYSRDGRTCEEQADTVVLLAGVLQARDVAFEQQETQLELPNGLTLRPQFVSLKPRNNGSVSTTTTIEVHHPELCPHGTFEYQHAVGEILGGALQTGFTGWVDTDLPVFMDALRETSETCMTMLMHQEGWTRKRRIILGPPMRAMLRAGPEPGTEDHEFCPCCLLTRSFDGFQEPIEGDAFCGVRLFASRDEEGVARSDCRINGVDWPAGAAALLKYVATWPGEGLEYRKQYVAFRSVPL